MTEREMAGQRTENNRTENYRMADGKQTGRQIGENRHG